VVKLGVKLGGELNYARVSTRRANKIVLVYLMYLTSDYRVLHYVSHHAHERHSLEHWCRGAGNNVSSGGGHYGLELRRVELGADQLHAELQRGGHHGCCFSVEKQRTWIVSGQMDRTRTRDPVGLALPR
jgi:hypothetical protein